ncbi:MAG: type 2 lanthipeptide synthetase LanM [Dermatophilaceae bacterium]
MTSWRSVGLRDDAAFAVYLGALGIDAPELASRLHAGSWTAIPGALDWVERLEGMARAEPFTGRLGATVGPQRWTDAPFDPFLRPFVGWYLQAVRILHPHLASSVHADLAEHAASVVLEVALRCLVEDYHRVRRTNGMGLADHLAGLADAGRRWAVLREYPAMARDLCDSLHRDLRACLEILDHWAADRSDLVTAAMIAPGATLTGLRLSAGDTHRGGRAVAVLLLDSRARVIHRPHDVDLHALYAEVAALLPRPLRALDVLPRDGYGWVEHAEHDGPGGAEYYRSFGALLAICWVLGARDLHLENVVACSEGPVPVDLETLLSAPPDREAAPAAVLAGDQLTDSVLGTGLLPVQARVADIDLDVSVLTGGLTSVRAHLDLVVGEGTDDLRIESVEVASSGRANVPSGTSATTVAAAVQDVVDGFVRTCRDLDAVGGAILAAVGRFGAAAVRIIVRPTRVYALLLRQTRHPKYGRSMLARRHLLDRLHGRSDDGYLTPAVVTEEIAQLLVGDIPYVTVGVGRRELASGRRSVGSRCAASPAVGVEQRLASLTRNSVAEQVSLLEDSVRAATEATLGTALERMPVGRGGATRPRPLGATFGGATLQVPDHDRLRALLDAVYQRYADAAVMGPDDVSWIGMASSRDGRSMQLQPLGTGLFDGLAGVGVALLDVARVLPGSGAATLAHRALVPVAAELSAWCDAPTGPVGAFSGAAGLAYALGRAEVQDGDGTWCPLLERFADTVAGVLDQDRYLDVSSGTSGALAVVVELHRRGLCSTLATERFVHAAVTHLGTTATRMGSAIAWRTGDAGVALGGFSHGASGVGWALARAAALDERAVALARSALRYEDRLRDPRTGLWRDLRPETRDREHAFPVHWCHGAAGIALARAEAGRLLGDDDLRRHGAEAASLVASQGLPPNDSLCHGSFGNALVLRRALQPRDRRAETYLAAAFGALLEGTFVAGLGVSTHRAVGLLVGHGGLAHAIACVLAPRAPLVLTLELDGAGMPRS